jgi:DNA adenine methylase
MKPPISYYGGKQRLASKLIPLIPKHTVYVEPFCGGATLLFRKPWPNVTNKHHYREVINDIDGDLINFFRQLRDNGDDLCDLLELTPYSEEEHAIAKDFDIENDLERARRYFVNIQQSFSNVLHTGWGRNVSVVNLAATWFNKVSCLREYVGRMMSVHIANTDALKCIQQFDSPQTLFYCDPPYPGTAQGHYSGYTLEDFQNLIDALASIDGSFILSCYECEAVIPESWERFEFSSHSSASIRLRGRGKRTEVVYRHISTKTVKPEIQKIYDSGKLDCFKGEGE